MAYCQKCGAANPEGAKFCQKCGTALTYTGPVAGDGPKAAPGVSKKKVFPVKLLFVLAVLVAVLAVGIVLLVKYANSRVNVGDYVEVEFSGGNGLGRAQMTVDTRKLYNKIRGIQGKSRLSASDSLSSVSNDAADLVRSVEGNLDAMEKLSNGDKVTVTVVYDEENAKKCGVRMENLTPAFTVSGLPELVKLDPFADISLTYSGYSPDAEAQLTNKSSNVLLKDASYTLSKSDGIAEGDTITVTCGLSEEEAEAKGYMLTGSTKDYKADKLDKYLTSISEISADFLTSLQKEASDLLDAYTVTYDSTTAVSNWQFVGEYMQTAKEGANVEFQNRVGLVYSATLTSSANNFPTQTIYFDVWFTNIAQISSGTQLYDGGPDLLGEADLDGTDSWYGGWSSKGYSDGTAMFREQIVAYKDRCNYEVTDGLKAFGS